ncbi:hypothetical protein LOZ65_006366 [Ophidiomyces ophidiicola]|nr:hypothetical protein LOZ65_006366 [Ophidiomyces ophidiicola]
MSPSTEEGTLEEFILENYPDANLLDTIGEGVIEATEVSSREARSSSGFRSWVRSIRNSRSGFSRGPTRFVTDWPEDEGLDESYRMFSEQRISRDDASFVTSSSFLHSIKTATMSLASLSVLNRGRSNTQGSSHHRSSTFSGSDPRRSMESNKLSTSVSLDELAWSHAVRRHRVIQELIDTETSYIAILRNLSQGLSLVFITPSAVRRCVDSLITLHESLLDRFLHRPNSSQSSSAFFLASRSRQVKRGHANSSTPSGTNNVFLDPRKPRGQTNSRSQPLRIAAAAPKEAADIASIIEAHLPRFLIYREYIAQYPLLQTEVEVFRHSKQNWQAYDQGLEALFRTVQPLSSREKYANHARTISDLLIQPVQRLCKYQLFLSDLLKCTPASHCPTTHEMLQGVYQKVVEVTADVNSSSADRLTLSRLRQTMELQLKLEFPSNEEYRDLLKVFGPIKVCGALHITYQARDMVNGVYMACALFGSHLLLAISSSDREKFRVMGIVFLGGARLEETVNGIGLHCATPYSWKLVFNFEENLVELMFSACSAKEESEWVRHLILEMAPESSTQPGAGSPRGKSSLYFDIKPLQAMIVNDRLLGAARRTSIHGTLVTLASPDYQRIYIKGTSAIPINQSNRPPLGRSQSVQNAERDIVIAPKRQKRVKLEKRLSDIWTRDIIPYPGMPVQGLGEAFMRSSTDALMGRLTSLPQFGRRANSNRMVVRTKSIEQFTIQKDDGNNKEDDEEDDPSSPSLEKEKDQDEEADKFDLKSTIIETPRSQRRGFMSLRKKYSMSTECDSGQGPVEILPKAMKQSLRKRLSVALFRTGSPSRSRRFKSVEV